MTTDIELLPLPEPDYLMPQGQGWPDIPAWSENTVRQLVAHATAAKDAEIEALRAEREVIGAEAVKYAEKSGRLEAKVYLLAEALRKLAAHTRPTCSVLWDEAQAVLREYEQEKQNEQ